MSIDRRVDEWMLHHRSDALTGVSKALMWVGTPGTGFLLFGALVVVASLWRRRPGTIVAVALAVQATAWVNFAIKHLVQRPRPGPEFAMVPAPGWSMPSTAAAVTTAGLVVLWRLAPAARTGRRALLACFALLDLAVVFAVIYLGTHWFSDTCVGALEGASLGLLARRITNHIADRWQARRQRRAAVPSGGA